MAGIEWLIEVFGCSEAALRHPETLGNLFTAIVSEMQLKPVGNCVWHQFPHTGGVTGFWLLRESHLAIHTFPEFQSACLNVFCCTERRPVPWESKMAEWLGATETRVREYRRIYRQ